MATRSPVVSVVIVNYNSGDYLRRCLDSLQCQTLQDVEVIVVDNASSDESMSHLDRYPNVHVIQNTSNRGFAAAQNQGICAGGGQYVMPLNFDIHMTPTFIEELVKSLDGNHAVGSVCGKLLRMTPNWELTSEIDSTGMVMLASGVPCSRGHGMVDAGQYDQCIRVAGAQGAAPMYRRAMLEDIQFEGQFFDEGFFAWYEDIDLDWRAYLRGWQTHYVPRAIAYHIGHGSSDPRPRFYTMMTIRNRWLMLLANIRLDDVRRCIWSMARYELSLLWYVARSRSVIAYGRALVGVCKLLRYTMRKRRFVQSRTLATRGMMPYATPECGTDSLQ